MNEEKIGKILNKLLQGVHSVDEYLCNDQEFHVAYYKFSVEGLLEDEIEFLKKVLTGEVKGSYFIYWIADTHQNPVLFEKKEDAKETVESQIRFLEKRFLFSAYNETGIIYKKPETANVTFFKKDKKGK